MDNNRFSIHRMILYIRQHLAVHGTKLLFAIGLIFGAYLAVVLFDSLTSQYRYINATLDGKDIQWQGICNVFIAAMFIVSCVAGSMFYVAYGSDRSRLQTLTIPVKQIEQFCAYFIIYIVGSFVIVSLYGVVIDWLRVAALKLFTPFGEYAHPVPLSTLFAIGEEPLNADTMKYLIVWWGFIFLFQSVFVVGSIYIPRNSFLITGCVLWGISMITGILGYLGTKVFYGSAPTQLRVFEYDTTPQTIAIKVLVFLIPILFLYWLSYYRMKQTEVTNRW